MLDQADANNNVGYLCFLEAKKDPKSESSIEYIDTARYYFQEAIRKSVKYNVKAEENLLSLNEWVEASKQTLTKSKEQVNQGSSRASSRASSSRASSRQSK